MRTNTASASHLLYPFEAYYLRSQKDDRELQKAMESVELLVKGYLASGFQIEVFVNGAYPTIWEAKCMALSWFAKNLPDLEDVGAEMDSILAAAHGNHRLETLAENLLFAIRINMRFMGSVSPSGGHNGQLPTIQAIPKVSLDEMLSLLSVQFPASAIGKVTEMLFASLDVEFGAFAAIFAINEQFPFSDEKLDELAGFLAGAAQSHGAMIREMHGAKRPSRMTEPTGGLSDEWLAEQHFLAETGLESLQKI